MPADAAKAVPLLERALTIESDYAGAHGLLAWCHQIFFARRGFSKVSREAAIRHAHAALAYGRDDATALALGGFVISMIEHDRATAFEAFEQALAISPSSSFALFFGSAALAYAGEAERAIDWAERALRISPFDRLNYASYHALAIGHFLRGRYDEAAHAARRAVQSVPSLSVSRSLLAAALAKLGRTEEAKAARTASAGAGSLLQRDEILCRHRASACAGRTYRGCLVCSRPAAVVLAPSERFALTTLTSRVRARTRAREKH